VTLLTAACLEPLREGPDPPTQQATGAVILGEVRTTTGAAVAGVSGEINVYHERTDGTLDYVGGQPLTTDATGEFVVSVVLADAGLFEASVHVVVAPPQGLALRADSAVGTVPFTTNAVDTLRVTVILSPT
jgi:hypothetical protein